MDPPRVRLLTAPALEAPRALPFLPERRFRLAVVLALSPDGCTRDELAALFWPDRSQAAARSNLRKLILELRRLGLPGIALEGHRLGWSVASDAEDLLAGRGVPTPWQEPLPGLDGSDSPAFDDWLRVQRTRLAEAWTAQQRTLARGSDAAAALAAAQRLLACDPEDAEARRHAARARLALAQDLPAAAPSGAGRRHDDVPDEDPGLIGRGTELAELLALLGERRCRLLTLVGPGGVGKSALALALLQQAAALEADGVRWVALEDLADAGAVPLRIARELGARVGPRSDGWDELVAALSGRQEVLVFDNAEHLTAMPALLERLRAALPRLRLLVTSRRRLGLADEWVLPLAPLDEAAARRLFLAAARRAPMRQPLPADDPRLAELVALLGGLPLALRLAAAWTRHLPLAALSRELQASLDLLQTGEDIDEHPAHRSLQATFERSWALLAPALRPVLAALGAGAGSMRLDVAQAMAAADAAQIAALADASLVALDAAGRVALHPLLRRFVRGKLDAASEQAALARHAEAMATLLRPYEDWDAADAAQALAVMAPEFQQIGQAWATAVDQRRADWLQVLCGPTGGLVQSQGGVDGVLPWMGRAQAMLEGLAGAPPATLCDLTLEHAGLHFWRGDQDPCEREARRALAVARAARLHRPMGQGLNLLALVALRRGQTARAATLMTQALVQARRAGHRKDIAIYAGNLSGIRRELGELALARAMAEEALAAHRVLGHAVGETAALAELSQIAHLQGRLDEAADFNLQALQVSERHGMALRRVGLLVFLGFVRLDQGRPAEGEALAAQALAELRAGAVQHYHEPTLRRLLAELALARGDAPAARAELRAALACVSPLAQDVRARTLLWSLAVLANSAGDLALAALLARRAEQDRPPCALPLPRYQRLRERLPVPPDPPPDDATLLIRIQHLLG